MALRLPITIVLCALLVGVAAGPSGAATRAAAGMSVAQVPLNGVFEQSLSWDSTHYSNPWEQATVGARLTSPTNKTYYIGGYYYAPSTWKIKFAPNELGTWKWTALLKDSKTQGTRSGTFNVVASSEHGFLRQSKLDRFRWQFADGTPYNPIGIGDCVLDRDKSGSPFDNDMGLDGIALVPTRVSLDKYLDTYGAAGMNIFRWSVDNCSFKLWETIAAGGNKYLTREGGWGDTFATKLHAHGFRVYMTMFNKPQLTDAATNPASMAALKRYVKYVVDRYGAQVDVWELFNEGYAPNDTYLTTLASYIRQIDPYKHPISTSWQRPDLAPIDVTSPHLYQTDDELAADTTIPKYVNVFKRSGKPVVYGEVGNNGTNWDLSSALRMRLHVWTAFFSESTLIFWNQSQNRTYLNRSAANIYIGPEERGYIKALQGWTAKADPTATPVAVTVSDRAHVRGYGLQSSKSFSAYLVNYTTHSSATQGVSIQVNMPRNAIATWTNSSDGSTLARVSVAAGKRMLAVPSFTTDVVLRVS